MLDTNSSSGRSGVDSHLLLLDALDAPSTDPGAQLWQAGFAVRIAGAVRTLTRGPVVDHRQPRLFLNQRRAGYRLAEPQLAVQEAK